MEKRVQLDNAATQPIEHWEDFELMRQYQAQCIEQAKRRTYGESLDLDDLDNSTQEDSF